MNAHERREDFQAKSRAYADQSFERWMSQATTRLMISLLPPIEDEEKRDIFNALLREAHSSGFASGAGATVVKVIEMMARVEEQKGKRDE